MPEDVTVRSSRVADRAAFLAMWRDFVALAPDEPGDRAMDVSNWQRITDPTSPLRCIVAENSRGAVVGFTLFLAFPFTWSQGDACYLQDIYVSAANRGQGVAQAMIAHLHRIGQDEKWFKIFWMTQHDNHPAQRLYEKVARRMDYIRYDLNIRSPKVEPALTAGDGAPADVRPERR